MERMTNVFYGAVKQYLASEHKPSSQH